LIDYFIAKFRSNQIGGKDIRDIEKGNDPRQLQKNLAEAHQNNSFNPNCSHPI
jgi:hypothetical protein